MTKEKLVVVGIDAADYNVTKSLLEKGELPRFSEVKDNGNFSCLNSVIPPNTAPGWTSITTGVNPGKHGIYYFYNFSTNPLTIVNASDTSTPRIWDYVRAINRRSVMVNVPVTYPVSEVSGSIIAGIPPWYFDERSVFPENLLQTLETGGYEIDTPMSRALENQPDFLVSKLIKTEEKRVEFFLNLLQKEGDEWSFGMIVITALDRLQHKTVGKGGEYDEAVARGYREIDRLFGKLVDSLGGDVNFLVVSDHGFQETPVGFYPNTWLFEHGLLKRKSSVSYRITKGLHDLFDGHLLWLPQSLTKRFQGAATTVRTIDAVDLMESRAFVPGTDGIVVVKSKDDLDIIKNGLSELKDQNGEKICKVYRKEEIFRGDRIDTAPELLIVPRDDVNIRSDPFSSDVVTRLGNFPRGNHSPYGILLATGTRIKHSGELNLNLEDVAPTALALLGIQRPEFMDGRVVSEFVKKSAEIETVGSPVVSNKTRSFNFSEAEERLVMDNLKRLGYT